MEVHLSQQRAFLRLLRSNIQRYCPYRLLAGYLRTTEEFGFVEVAVLEERGRRSSTINKLLTALTKFYRYCQDMGVDGGVVADPAGQIPRLKERKYRDATYLGHAEIQALQGAP